MRAFVEVSQVMERWLDDQGFPHLKRDYNPPKRWPRALGLLRSLVGVELSLVILRWPTDLASWITAAYVLAYFTLGGFLVEDLQDRILEQKDRYWKYLVALAPTLLVAIGPCIPLMIQGQHVLAGSIAFINLSVLMLGWVSAHYALESVTFWFAREVSFKAIPLCFFVARALPLLLVFATFLAVQNELWQISARLNGAFLWVALLVFPAAGTLFMLLWALHRVGSHPELETWEAVQKWRVEVEKDLKEKSGSSVSLISLSPSQEGSEPKDYPLRKDERINLAVNMLLVLGLQITLICLTVWAFLLIFGRLTVDKMVADDWIRPNTTNVLWDKSSFGHSLGVSEELITVSALLASFSGLYFTLQAVKDEAYYKDFLEDLDKKIRKALAIRYFNLRIKERDAEGGDGKARKPEVVDKARRPSGGRQPSTRRRRRRHHSRPIAKSSTRPSRTQDQTVDNPGRLEAE